MSAGQDPAVTGAELSVPDAGGSGAPLGAGSGAAGAVGGAGSAVSSAVSVGEWVGRALAAFGARRAFGVVGSGNFVVTNALVASGVDFVAARHEGGAIVMADAHARLGGGVGVVTVHQGCGLTNTATGLGEAAKSRTPLVLVAAAAPLGDPTNNFAMDQDGFGASVGALTFTVESASAVASRVHAAWTAALGLRAVLLNLPIDVQAQPAPDSALALLAGWEAQAAAAAVGASDPFAEPGNAGLADAAGTSTRAAGAPAAAASGALGEGQAGTEAPASGLEFLPAAPAPVEPSHADLAALAALLGAAERPVIIAGRGARGAGSALRALAAEAGALLATSAVAKGLFAEDPWDLGISGGFATPLTAELIRGADAVVGFGCALNDWTTRRGALLAPEVRLAQVDVSADALGRHRPVELGVVGDAALVARGVTEYLAHARSGLDGEPGGRYRTDAVSAALADRGSWNRTPTEDLSGDGRVDPRVVTAALDRILPPQRVVSTDSGNFMGYPSQYLSVPDQDAFCFTQAFQSIGLGLGTAIGAALAQPARVPVLGTGDGGFLMGIADLETAVRLGLGLLVVVYNDAAYGAEVHHFGPQDPGVDLRQVTFPETQLAALAVGFGADAAVVRSVSDLDAVKRWLAAGRPRPLVLDVKVASDGGAWWLQEAFARH